MIYFSNFISAFYFEHLEDQQYGIILREVVCRTVCTLDFLGIPRYSNKNPLRWAEHLPTFCGDAHLAAHHVASFMDYISKVNVEHEDVVMRMFHIAW